ncbi:MAG TPA: CHRD domain-containing protein, partial [Terriglobia bacterium]|nr:CHRD domain-containing protein [Terriglobia bacterium]
MRRLCVIVLFSLLVAPHVFGDSQDTVVFRTRMLPDNEVPPIAAPGNSASATITVHVTRDEKANVNAATVTFDIDYTIASALTFTGLHIHNGLTGQNGPVVIDTGISGTNTVAAAAGSGKITRVVNYASTDANGIKFVTGLLATPENYYVNIHTTVNPGGFMRGQLQSSRLIFRPVMSSVFEVPAVNLDAEGAALVDVQVNRDPQTGAITSGTVIFDVDYRFPDPVTITGLHIHNGPMGVNAPVVIDTGTNATSTAVTNVTRGNIFRIVEISASNTNGIAALNGLFTDPTQYYINMHTTVNPGGVIRGQLAKNVYVFYNQMTQAEENPPTGVSGAANSMTYVRIDRDSTGNVVSGAVSFNLNYAMGAPTTFTGLHIHNAKVGVNGPVVINTGISGTIPVISTA